MNYHIARDGQQIGVFSREDALARLNRGEIRPTDLAWCEGMAEWKPVSEVLGAVPPPMAAPPPAPGPLPAVPAPQPAGTRPPKPSSYLALAIPVTLLCCLPLGIVSIVFAAQVDSKYTAGDYAGAEEASRKAKVFGWWAFGLGLGVQLIGGIVYFAMIAAAVASSGGY